MAQKTPALRDAKGERVADARCVSPRALGIIGFGVPWRSAWCVVFASDTGLKQVAQAAWPPDQYREASRGFER